MLHRLGCEAREAGGDVVRLLGNHEVMNMLGDFRYVTTQHEQLLRPLPHSAPASGFDDFCISLHHCTIACAVTNLSGSPISDFVARAILPEDNF